MRFIFAAGGTGGHIIPALAIARELRAAGVEVIFSGTIVQVKGVFGRQSEKIATSIKTLSAC